VSLEKHRHVHLPKRLYRDAPKEDIWTIVSRLPFSLLQNIEAYANAKQRPRERDFQYYNDGIVHIALMTVAIR
jgi:hypothetical protein